MELVRLNSRSTGASARSDDQVIHQACYSVRMVRAFVRLLSRNKGFPSRVLEEIETLDIDDRIPVIHVHRILQATTAFSEDPDLGLKAAREVSFGELGVFDYAMSTAATVGEAIETAVRYRRLISDATCFRIQLLGERAIFQVENSVIVPRCVVDFQLAVLYKNHFSSWPVAAHAGFEVWFTDGEPESVLEYGLSFPAVKLRFSMPSTGFVFKKDSLLEPLQTADRNLHALVKRNAELMLAVVPKTPSMTERVRELIMTELSTGGPYAERVSRELDISSRTLIRRLEEEGNTFKELLDDVRRRLALGYVGNRDVKIADVAFLLGFSHISAFYRAFKRWTDQTPIEYRHSRRR